MSHIFGYLMLWFAVTISTFVALYASFVVVVIFAARLFGIRIIKVW